MRTTDEQIADWRPRWSPRSPLHERVDQVLDALVAERDRADKAEEHSTRQQIAWMRIAVKADGRLETANARIAELESHFAAVAAVRALHSNVIGGVLTQRWVGYPRADRCESYCVYCSQTWPCETERLLTTIEDGA